MLKSVMWDVFVTVAIIIAVIFDVSVLRIMLLIYTPLIIFAKIVALRSKIVQHRVKNTAPTWLFHVLYALNILFLVIQQWWILAGMWLIVWLLSTWFYYKVTSKLVSPDTGKKKNR